MDMELYEVTTKWWFDKVDLNLDPTLLPPATDSFGLMVRVKKVWYNHAFDLKRVAMKKIKYPISNTVLLSDEEAHSCFSQFLSTVGITLDCDNIFHNILSGCRGITIDTSSSTTTSLPFSKYLSTFYFTLDCDHVFRNTISSCDQSEHNHNVILSIDRSATSVPFFSIDIYVLCLPWISDSDSDSDIGGDISDGNIDNSDGDGDVLPASNDSDSDIDDGDVLPASKSSVQALEKVILIQDYMDLCMICLDKFLLGSKVTRMPCDHIYHEDCIVHWLEIRNFCPVCRFKMPTTD